MNNDLIHVNTLPPFKKFCMTIGELPTSYLESMTYYETLVWLCNYLQKTVIPTVNTNSEAITELQNYVSTYFDNLDVQEEINNKLDAMVESGELQEILSEYTIPYTKDSYILAVFHDYISDDYYNPYSGGVGDGRTPRFLLSKDGVNFAEFNKDIYPLMINAPTTPNGWCGAPSIVFWQNKFFMVSSGGIKTATNDGAIGVSDDLIHWTWYDYTLGVRYAGAQVIIPAPEFCILNNKLYLIESIFTGEYAESYLGEQVTVTDPYIAEVLSFDETDGFTFSEAKKLIFYEEGNDNLSTDRSHIDTVITYKDGLYYALSKNEVTVTIESFVSSDLENWEILNRSCFWRFTEAPTVCYYGGVFHVYADASQLEAGSQNEMYHAITDDFITFKYFDSVKAPRKYTTRHGSVFTITADNIEANKIIRSVPDVAIGADGIKKQAKYLGLSTRDIQFYIQEGNTRETTYMSICPNTIYYINADHDYIIDNLDNTADVGEVKICFTPNVTNASLLIKNSGTSKSYTSINDYFKYNDSYKNKYITLIKDGNGILRIGDRNPITESILAKFSSFGTFTDTSWVNITKINDVVTISGRLIGLDENTTKTLTTSSIDSKYRPSKTCVFSGLMRSSGAYVGSTWITCYIVVNVGGSIQVFTSDNVPSGAYFDFTITYKV